MYGVLVYSSLAGERTDFSGEDILLDNLGLKIQSARTKNVEELMRFYSYFSILHLLLSKSIDSGYRVLQISCWTLFFLHTCQRYCTCY